jgi:hypothetical protein
MRDGVLLVLAAACGPQPQPQPQPQLQMRDCPERYDDTNAERAATENVTAATKLLALARVGDRAALTRSLAPANTADVAELERLMMTIPVACDLVWYAQPGRFAVQPALDDEPQDPARDAFADAINAADHIVATCDAGCGVLALALRPADRAVVAWMVITQRPGNAR